MNTAHPTSSIKAAIKEQQTYYISGDGNMAEVTKSLKEMLKRSWERIEKYFAIQLCNRKGAQFIRDFIITQS